MFMEVAANRTRHCLKFSFVGALLLFATNVAAQKSDATSASKADQKTDSTKGIAGDGGRASPGAQANSGAPPPSLNECLSIHREAQALRKQYRLLESRGLLLECSHDACPAPVKRDCVRWADEVDAQLPSVVFRTEGGDNTQWDQLKIYIDDEQVATTMHNRAVDLNPGTHRFKFVLEGKPTLEKEVVTGEGEKYKTIVIKFDSANEPTSSIGSGNQQSSLAKASTTADALVPAAEQKRPVPTATYVFAGVGVAAAANFAVWGLLHRSLYNELDRECKPDCDQSYVDKVRTRGIIADVSLGVSVASFATAGVLYLLRPTITLPAEVRVGTLPHGGFIGTVQISHF